MLGTMKMSRLLTSFLVAGSVRVVAQQAFGGLTQTRGVTHSRACSWQYRNTPGLEPSRDLPIRSAFNLWKGSRGHGGRRLQVVAELRRGCRGRQRRRPRFRAARAATSRAAAAGLAFIAATTWATVLVTAPEGPVARLTVIALPLTVTLERLSCAAPGSLSCAVMSLPPFWPNCERREHDRLRLADRRRTASALPVALLTRRRPPVDVRVRRLEAQRCACDLRW